METWEKLIASLATRGGNIVVLLLVNIFLGIILLHVLHHVEANAEARGLVLSSFSAAFGALLLSLQNAGGQRKEPSLPGNSAGNPAQPVVH